jgi:hypothetical protein
MFLWLWTWIRCTLCDVKMKVHPVVYFLFKTLVALTLALIFIGVPAGVYYQRVHGIGFGVKEALEQALSSPLIEVKIAHLSLNPFLGLVARDLRIKERVNGHNTLASINKLSVSLNLGELMLRRFIVESLSLRQANASIPILKSHDGRRVEIHNIHAEIILLGGSLRLSSFEAVVEGIQVRLKGEIQNPLTFQIPRPQQNKGMTDAPPPPVEDFFNTLSELSFPSGQPVVSATFEVNASKPESLRISNLAVTCPKVERQGLSLSDVKLKGDYAEGKLSLSVIELKDKDGRLEASGEWDTNSAQARLSLRANLNPAPLLAAFTPGSDEKDEPSFESAPHIDAELTADFTQPDGGLRVIGNFLAPDITYKGITFREVGFGFAWASQCLHLRDVSFQATRGSFSGNLWIAPGDYRLEAQTSIPPTDLSSLMDRPTREFLEKMQVAELPEITISLRTPKLDFAAMKGSGHLKLGKTSMRGAWIDSGEADLEIADSCVTYKNILITTGPGKGTGSFAYDVGRQEVRFANIRSTLVPTEVLMWIDPNIAKTISPYRFRSNPSVSLEGKVHMRTATKNNLTIQVESPAGMDYDLLGKTLTFGKTSARVLVIGNRVDARVTRAPIMDGEVTLQADVSIDPKNPVFSAKVQLERVNFSKLTQLYFNYADSKGVVSGQYNFTTRMGDEEMMTGNGNIRIEDGNVFAIPVLGPFSTIIGAILPGVAYNTARFATADFTVADKKINTKNIEIVGSGFSMFGDGDIYFLTGDLDMDMRLNAQGVPGIVFFPMSKLFSYHSDGTFSNPGWLPKIIPRLPGFGGPKKQTPNTP